MCTWGDVVVYRAWSTTAGFTFSSTIVAQILLHEKSRDRIPHTLASLGMESLAGASL